MFRSSEPGQVAIPYNPSGQSNSGLSGGLLPSRAGSDPVTSCTSTVTHGTG